VGCISSRIRKPYEFGDDASKKTGLWLVGLLVGDDYVEIVDGRPRWSNQSDAGQSRSGGGSGKARSVTYDGIALAMGMQWG